MKSTKYDISAGALLVLALAYFFDGTGMLSALAPAVAVHEAGHLVVLCFLGARIRRVKLSFFGLEIDYSGHFGGKYLVAAIAAGPIAGLVYFVTAISVKSDFLKMSGAISLLLSVFNLLPAMPLDGGRIVAALFGARPAKILSLAVSGLIAAAGLWALFSLGAPSLLLMGAWLAAFNLF